MLLAETGFVTESAAVLRTVIDFAREAYAIAEGELQGEPTRAQQDFVSQFFERRLHGPDEQRSFSRQRYVGRDELIKAHVRLVDDAGLDGERQRDLLNALAEIYDKYVHGAYATAMELYHGGGHRSMLAGHESGERRELLQYSVASALVQVVHVLGAVALVMGDKQLSGEIIGAATTLWRSLMRQHP